jgi:hypothetical protein
MNKIPQTLNIPFIYTVTTGLLYQGNKKQQQQQQQQPIFRCIVSWPIVPKVGCTLWNAQDGDLISQQSISKAAMLTQALPMMIKRLQSP